MSDYENLPEGEHEGRLVLVADCGWHVDEYKGERKGPFLKAALGIETVDSDVEINGEKQPRLLWTRPFNVFPALTERGKEMEYYSVFDPKAEPGFSSDWESQLGKPCNVIVKHVKSKDRTFDNIDKLTPIPAKYQDKVSKNRIETDAWGEKSQSKLFGLAKWMKDNEPDNNKKEAGNGEDFDDPIPDF